MQERHPAGAHDEAEVPEGGYPGEYMVEIAKQLKEERGDSLLRPPGEPYPPELHDLGVAKMVDGIKGDLAAIVPPLDVR